MVVGYVAKWIMLLEAIQYVQRVLGDTLEDALDKLLTALREGAVTARYHGKDIGGIAAHFEGTGGGVPPARWYKVAAVFDDGSVGFTDNPNFPFPRPIRLREHIEVQRCDLERWWPTPPQGETKASTTDSPTKTISLIEAVQNTPRLAQRHGGRKKGSGSIDDTERLQLMMRFLATEQARSVHDAACKVADSTAGSSQSRTAEITRIRTKFAKDHGTEPPPGKTWADVEAELKDN